MLTKDNFSLTYLFLMLLNTGKQGKLSLHKIFHRNKDNTLFMPQWVNLIAILHGN